MTRTGCLYWPLTRLISIDWNWERNRWSNEENASSLCTTVPDVCISLTQALAHTCTRILTHISTTGCARTSARSLRAAEETCADFPGEIRVLVRAERNISEVKGGRERMQGSLESFKKNQKEIQLTSSQATYDGRFLVMFLFFHMKLWDDRHMPNIPPHQVVQLIS